VLTGRQKREDRSHSPAVAIASSTMTEILLPIVIFVGLAAAGVTFHFYRPGKRRSPEAAVAMFSAMLAAGAWIDTVLDRRTDVGARDAELRIIEGMLTVTLRAADSQAARRDQILAEQIEAGFRRAGLEAPAAALRSVQTQRLREASPPADPTLIRRLAEAETELRLRGEQRDAEVRRQKAELDAVIRRLCSRESYRDTDRCKALRTESGSNSQ
jgi:hypothetical protein